MTAMGDSYVSTDHLLLALARTGQFGLDADAIEKAIPELRGGRPVTSDNPEGTFEALSKYGTDLTARAREGKLDPVIGRDAEIRRVVQVLSPPHEEQPRPHRRARRRQDGRRRGARPAHRRGRRAREPARQDALLPRPRGHARRREVPRRVRGAAQGRPRGDQGQRRPDRHLHRRDPHRRRRGRRRRGRHGRRQHAQAHARPRRAAPRRRDDARRVPQAHREGRRARAPLPAGLRRRAVGRGHHRHPPRPQGALRGAPQGDDRRLGPRRRRVPLRPLHHADASCPTRPSTSSTRRPRGCAWRSTRAPSRSTSSAVPSTG